MAVKRINLSKAAKRSRKVSRKQNKKFGALPLSGMNCRCEVLPVKIEQSVKAVETLERGNQ